MGISEGLFVLFVVLQIADILTTLLFLKEGIQEGNPIVRKAMEKFGPLPALFVLKSVVIVIGYRLSPHVEVIALVNAFYLGVVCWNVKRIMEEKQ